MNQITALQGIGLSEKEAKAYDALLGLQKAGVQEIAALAKINRPTAYAVLESLAAKGLCSISKTGGKTFFVIESPQNILSLIRSEKKRIEEQERLAFDLIKEIESIPTKKKETAPFIRYFSGKKGLIAMRNDMFNKGDSTLRMLYSLDNYEKAYDDMDKRAAHAARINKNNFAKIIYSSDKGKITNDKMREARKVAAKAGISADIAVYDDKVRLSHFDGSTGVIISNKKIAETLSALFDIAWSKLK